MGFPPKRLNQESEVKSSEIHRERGTIHAWTSVIKIFKKGVQYFQLQQHTICCCKARIYLFLLILKFSLDGKDLRESFSFFLLTEEGWRQIAIVIILNLGGHTPTPNTDGLAINEQVLLLYCLVRTINHRHRFSSSLKSDN